MRTLIMEAIVQANTPISHNGGELNGNVAMFRRMPIIQPNGRSVEVPVVSGNGIRGKLRDVASEHMLHMLGEEETPHRVPLHVFQMLFSGGSLTAGNTEGDVDKWKQLYENLPVVALFGTAYGNAIIPGRMNINPLIPICIETHHIIPPEILEFFAESGLKSAYTFLDQVMHTRKENAKDPRFEQYLEPLEEGVKFETSQMIYYVEVVKAGTPFYWRVVLQDVDDVQYDFFLSFMKRWESVQTVGGKSSIGFGQLEFKEITWRDVSKEGEVLNVSFESTESLYAKMMKEAKPKVRAFMKMI